MFVLDQLLFNTTGILSAEAIGVVAQLRQSVRGAWLFDNPGDIGIDSRRQRDAAVVGTGINSAPGLIEDSVFFQNSGGYLDVTDTSGLSFIENPYTFSGWIKIVDDQYFGAIISVVNVDNASNILNLFRHTNRTLSTFVGPLWSGGPFLALSTPTFTFNVWHHFIFEYDVSTASLEFDGQRLQRDMTFSLDNTSNVRLFIGRDARSFGLPLINTYVDELYLFDRVLTEDEKLFLRGGNTLF